MAGDKYEVTSRIRGGKGLEVGAVVELTTEQYNSSLYRTRVRKIAGQGSGKATLTPATPGKAAVKEASKSK